MTGARLDSDATYDEVARAVGRVAMRAARVEHMASVLAVVLIGTPRAAPVVLGQGWASTKRALEELISEQTDYVADLGADERRYDVPVYEGMLATLRHADRLMAERSNVVHALWDVEIEGDAKVAMTTKRWGRERTTTWTLAQLDDLQSQLLTVDQELVQAVEWISP